MKPAEYRTSQPEDWNSPNVWNFANSHNLPKNAAVPLRGLNRGLPSVPGKCEIILSFAEYSKIAGNKKFNIKIETKP